MFCYSGVNRQCLPSPIEVYYRDRYFHLWKKCKCVWVQKESKLSLKISRCLAVLKFWSLAMSLNWRKISLLNDDFTHAATCAWTYFFLLMGEILALENVGIAQECSHQLHTQDKGVVVVWQIEWDRISRGCLPTFLEVSYEIGVSTSLLTLDVNIMGNLGEKMLLGAGEWSQCLPSFKIKLSLNCGLDEAGKGLALLVRRYGRSGYLLFILAYQGKSIFCRNWFATSAFSL